MSTGKGALDVNNLARGDRYAHEIAHTRAIEFVRPPST
jgi:hypothetical protein